MKSFATSICPIKKSSRSEYEASPHHPRAAKRSSDRSLARPPCPQVAQWHPRVAKLSSIGPSARRPCPQAPQRHPRVADPPPTDLKTVSFRCHTRSSARRPLPRRLRGSPAPSPRHPRAIPVPSPHHPRAIPVLSQCHPSAARPSPNRSQNGFFPVS